MTLRYSVLLIFFLLAWSACKPGRPEVPEGVLAPSEMVGLLSDLHVAESLAEHEARKQEKDGTTLLQGYRNSVLRKRGVSSGLFQKSMEFYRQNPEYLGEIYLEVITELSKKEAVVSASH